MAIGNGRERGRIDRGPNGRERGRRDRGGDVGVAHIARDEQPILKQRQQQNEAIAYKTAEDDSERDEGVLDRRRQDCHKSALPLVR